MEQEKIINIEELVQDEHNFNKGTDEGGKLMERSFKEMGAGRSVLIDKHGKIIKWHLSVSRQSGKRRKPKGKSLRNFIYL